MLFGLGCLELLFYELSRVRLENELLQLRLHDVLFFRKDRLLPFRLFLSFELLLLGLNLLGRRLRLFFLAAVVLEHKLHLVFVPLLVAIHPLLLVM